MASSEVDLRPAPMFSTILWSEPEPGVILITLNRPPMNAVSMQMLDELREAVEIVRVDDSVRVLIITGQGTRAFSAGADMEHFTREFEARGTQPPAWFRFVNNGDFLGIETLPKPVICAINGTAVGEGLEIAMASDLRVAGRSARIGFPEANIGLIPASGGCSRIVKLLGLAKAKEMVLLGELIEAEEACRIGLVWKVVDDADLMPFCLDVAKRLSRKAPLALGLAKAVLTAGADVDVHSAHTLEVVAQSLLMKTADHVEGVEAFLAKRPPAFEGI